MTSLLLRAVPVLVVLAVGLALPRTVHACSTVAECSQPLVLPADGATIPANATELLVLLRGGGFVASGAPHLVGSDGTEIALMAVFPSSRGTDIARMRVVGTLVAGESYRFEGLVVIDACGSAVSPGSSFFVGPAATPPTGGGSLRLGEQGIREVDGGCGDTFDESFAELAYTEDPSMGPWRALATGEIIVDGSTFGGVGPLASSWRASRSCDDDGATTRTASLAVTVAGISRDETNAVDVDLSCSSFEGCSVGRTRRAPGRTPTRLAVVFFFGAVVFAAIRRSRR